MRVGLWYVDVDGSSCESPAQQKNVPGAAQGAAPRQ